MLGQNGTRALVWIDDIDCDIAEFRRHVERKTLAHDYPSAAEISSNIPVYDG